MCISQLVIQKTHRGNFHQSLLQCHLHHHLIYSKELFRFHHICFSVESLNLSSESNESIMMFSMVKDLQTGISKWPPILLYIVTLSPVATQVVGFEPVQGEGFIIKFVVIEVSSENNL